MAKAVSGKVYLVGAGPGDPGLLTLKGRRCLEEAHVILYDRLVSEEILSFASPDAELIYCGKKAGGRSLLQRKIETVMIRQAAEGKIVVRLKGGDPFIFGRGSEETEALRSAGIPYEVVPGVSSAIAASAYAGIPLTHRDYSSSVATVTGHQACGGKGAVKWGQLRKAVDTLVILMGVANLRQNMNRLIEAGCDPEKPVALIRWGTLPSQKALLGTVMTIADLAEQHGFKAPVVIVVGNVVRLMDKVRWVEQVAGSKRCDRIEASRDPVEEFSPIHFFSPP